MSPEISTIQRTEEPTTDIDVEEVADVVDTVAESPSVYSSYFSTMKDIGKQASFMTPTGNCTKCKVAFGLLKWSSECPKDSQGCGNKFCASCHNYSLVLETNLESEKITTLCKSCFKTASSLDHSKTYQVFMYNCLDFRSRNW
jgi:hypothetical protein